MRHKSARIGNRNSVSLTRRALSALLVAFSVFGAMPSVAVSQTTPSNVVYEGRLLDANRDPITTAVTFRFSLWKSGDWVSSDTTGAGAINTAATQYGGWYETQNVTPDAGGVVSVKLGNGTAFPTIDFANHKYMQVEVKNVGAADTSYQRLDPDGDGGAGTDDRQFIGAAPYALNAESVDNRSPGTSSGNLVLLGSGGKLNVGGTNANSFTLDADNSAPSSIALTFGAALSKALSYNVTAGWFEFNDDVHITNGGGLTASGAIATETGVVINVDNQAKDAVLTFGNDLGAETLRFSDSTNRFEFSDDVNVNGNLTVNGLVNGVDISSLGTETGTYLRASSGGGLNLRVSQGSYSINGLMVNFAGSGAMVMRNNASNYVFFTSTGLTLNTSGFPTNRSVIPVALVTTANGGISLITDRRILSDADRQRVVMSTYNPGYQSVSYQGDASNNVGQLSVSHDNISKRNFYIWTSTLSSLQDYDVILRVTLPPDFARWKNNALQVDYRSTSADTANNQLDIEIYDTNGVPVTLSGSVSDLANTSWTTAEIEFAGSPTWTAGQDMLVRFRPQARNTFQMQLGIVRTHFVTGDAGDDPNDPDD